MYTPDSTFKLLGKLSDAQLYAVQIALTAYVARPDKPWLWLARWMALKAVNIEIERRKTDRDHLVGSSLSEEAPDGD